MTPTTPQDRPETVSDERLRDLRNWVEYCRLEYTDDDYNDTLAVFDELRRLRTEGNRDALAPHAKWLRKVAADLYEWRYYGHSNTCESAADAIDAALALEARKPGDV